MAPTTPKNNEPYQFHPNLSDEINRNIAESQLLGGVYLKDLPDQTKLNVTTMNSTYKIQKNGNKYFIIGHPKYCPYWTKCIIQGSTWGGSMIKLDFIGIGMRLEFSTNDHQRIVTSTIQEIVEDKNS